MVLLGLAGLRAAGRPPLALGAGAHGCTAVVLGWLLGLTPRLVLTVELLGR